MTKELCEFYPIPEEETCVCKCGSDVSGTTGEDNICSKEYSLTCPYAKEARKEWEMIEYPSYKFTKKKDIVPFGKYRRQSIAYILDKDPAYILWMRDQDNIKIARKIVTEAEWNTYDEGDEWGNFGDEWWKD